jgi:hypothetical protein
MKRYQIVIITKHYKTIEVKAKNEEEAEYAAWDWANNNNTLDGADVEIETYDLEEITE